MKNAALKQKCLRLIKRHSQGTGTFSWKRNPTNTGWDFSWSDDQTREVRQTVADHARDP